MHNARGEPARAAPQPHRTDASGCACHHDSPEHEGNPWRLPAAWPALL